MLKKLIFHLSLVLEVILNIKDALEDNKNGKLNIDNIIISRPGSGIEPKDYLESNNNIYDYCAGVKIRGNWTFYETSVVDGEYRSKRIKNILHF